jgi:hypothetical protein
MAKKCSLCKKKLTEDDVDTCATCTYVARRAAEAAANAARRAKAGMKPKPRPRKPAPPRKPDGKA